MKRVIISLILIILAEAASSYIARGLSFEQECYALLGLLLFADYTIYQKVVKSRKGLTPLSIAPLAMAGTWLTLTPFYAPSTWWQEEVGAIIGVNAMYLEKWTFFVSFSIVVLAVNYCAGTLREGFNKLCALIQRKKRSGKILLRRERNRDIVTPQAA